MTLSACLLSAIAKAVERQGGDYSDVQDLVAAWERLHSDQRGRSDRLRYEAANPSCICPDGGTESEDGRCGRCWRRRREAAGMVGPDTRKSVTV
jgi:hypothetical protein